MKISFLVNQLRYGGGVRRIVELSNRLVERGHDVTIYNQEGEPCRWLEVRAAVEPETELLNRRHEVLIYNDFVLDHVRVLKQVSARLKVIYFLDLPMGDEHLITRWYDPRIYCAHKHRVLACRRLLRSPWLKLSNATWMEEWLRSRMGIKTIPVVGAVNMQMFRPSGTPHDNGRFVIIATGDRRVRKGTDVIRKAVTELRSRGRDVLLKVFQDRNLPQDQMSSFYCSGHIYLDAQWWGGWNNPVAEAMACKVPVVCTNIGAVHDFAEHEQTALLVRPGDWEGMANAVDRLADDPALRQSLAQRAFERIAQFDWEKTTDRLEAVLGEHLACQDINGPGNRPQR